MHKIFALEKVNVNTREIKRKEIIIRWGNNEEGSNKKSNGKIKGVTKLDFVTRLLYIYCFYSFIYNNLQVENKLV